MIKMKPSVLVKNVSNSNLRAVIQNSIKDVKDHELTDEVLENFKKDYGEYPWTVAMKAIGQELRPKKIYEKEDRSITAIIIVSTDEGKKDNRTYHFAIHEGKMVRIKDRGEDTTEFGGVYSFDCTAYIDPDDHNKISYVLKKDAKPEKLEQLSKKETIKRLKQIAKPIEELKHNEMAVIEVQIQAQVTALKSAPMYIKDKRKGTGFNFLVRSIQQEVEEADAKQIALFFFPQRYCEQTFIDIFPPDYKETILSHAQDDMTEWLLAWLVPNPPELKTLAIGKTSIQTEGEYAGSVSFMPCAGLIMDESQMEEVFGDLLEGIASGEIAQDEPEFDEEADVEEDTTADDHLNVKEPGDLEVADDDNIAMYLEFNPSPDFDAKQLNQLLAKKGLFTTDVDMNRVRKAQGMELPKTKKKPAKKKPAKKKSKKKTTKKKGGK